MDGSAAPLAFRHDHFAPIPVEYPDCRFHLVAAEQWHDASGEQCNPCLDVAIRCQGWPSALKKLSDAAGIDSSMSASERDTSRNSPDFLTSF